MPTSRFSTMSRMPMPFLPPSSFRPCDDLGGLHLLAVQGHGDALFKLQGEVGGLVGGLDGGDAHFQEAGLVVLRLVGGVLQVQTLVAQVPEVLILGVVGLPADLQGDVVGLGVVDLLVPALDVPLPPGGDDLHAGSKPLDGQLEPDLVVALAGAAVARWRRRLRPWRSPPASCR